LLEWLEPEWKRVARARSGSEVLSIMDGARLNLPIDAHPEIAEVLLSEEPCSLMITSRGGFATGRVDEPSAEALFEAVATLDRGAVEELAPGFSFAGITFDNIA
jgi:hypothetical protein